MNIVDEGPEDHEEDVLHEIRCADLDIRQLNDPLRVCATGRGRYPYSSDIGVGCGEYSTCLRGYLRHHPAYSTL
jgi:hypothetical protein